MFNLPFFKTDRFLAIVHQIRSLEDKEMLEEMKGHLTLLCRRVPYVYTTVPYRTPHYRTVPYPTLPYRTVPYSTVLPYCTLVSSTLLSINLVCIIIQFHYFEGHELSDDTATRSVLLEEGTPCLLSRMDKLEGKFDRMETSVHDRFDEFSGKMGGCGSGAKVRRQELVESDTNAWRMICESAEAAPRNANTQKRRRVTIHEAYLP